MQQNNFIDLADEKFERFWMTMNERKGFREKIWQTENSKKFLDDDERSEAKRLRRKDLADEKFEEIFR